MKTTQVTFELIDFELSSTTGSGGDGNNYYSKLLLNKFASQQFNMCKWFRKRDEYLLRVKMWDFASIRESNCIPLEFMECRQVVQQAVSKNCQLFIEYSSGSFPEWKFDKELLKNACQLSGGMLHYGDPSIAFDDDVIEEVCQCKGFSLDHPYLTLPKFENNKAFLMKVVEKNPFNLCLINNDLINDEDIISMAAKYKVILNGESTVNKHLAKIYIRSNADNLLQLTKFHNDVEIIEMAVRQNGLALKYSSIDTPYNVVKIAVKQNGLALEFASDAFRDSVDIVQLAVKQNGLSLKFASERLRSDNSIAKIAISNNPLAIEHVINVCLEIQLLQESVMERMSQDYILKSIDINNDCCYLKHVPSKWWNDIHFVEKALLVNETVYHFLPHHLQTNKEFLLWVLSKNILIEIHPFLLESDEEFLFKCFAASSPLCAEYKFTHNQLSDREFIKKALTFNSRILTTNNEVFTLYRYDREMVMHGLKQDPCIAISFPDLLSDREVVLELAKFNGFFCELFQQSPIPFEILSHERFNAEYENVYMTRNNRDLPKQRFQ